MPLHLAFYIKCMQLQVSQQLYYPDSAIVTIVDVCTIHQKNVVCNVLLHFPAEQQKALAMQKRKEEAERATAMQIQFAKDQDQAHRENIERLEKRMKEDAEANRKHYEEMVTHRLEEQKRFMMEGFKKESDALNARIEDLRRQQQQQANQQRSRGGCILL